jgi:putative dimethyl sulfoxide reductase chaperone
MPGGQERLGMTQNKLEFLGLLENRAASYALFARLFREEITPELLDQLRQNRGGLNAPGAAGEGQDALDHYLRMTEAPEPHQVIAELAADFAGLFLNAGGRPAYPYESVHTSPERLLMQQARAEVRQAYVAAGLTRSDGCREPEDHIALEMEFMRHLCSCTVAALQQGNPEPARMHLQRQRQFLERHLLAWGPKFCEDVVRNATTDFYRAVGCLLRDFLRFEKEMIDLLMI